MGPVERSLAWDGCFNVRDLGGLETASGRRTRHGSVVRADNIRRLSTAGWRSAHDHGIRRAVDLRFPNEPPGGATRPERGRRRHLPLRRHDPVAEGGRRAPPRMPTTSAGSRPATSARWSAPETVAAAVAAVADADEGDGVVIHCFAGKDRTGIVSALLLGARCSRRAIASDYAESAANMGGLFDGGSPRAGRRRARDAAASALAAAETMEAVLAWLGDAGGARAYLADAGLTEDRSTGSSDGSSPAEP